MCAAGCCHLHWLVTLFKRGDMRAKFGIQGDGCTDCLVRPTLPNDRKCADSVLQASYFCFPCTLAQMETEIKDRAALLQHSAGKPEGYSQPQGGMAYQQPGQPAPAYQNGKY